MDVRIQRVYHFWLETWYVLYTSKKILSPLYYSYDEDSMRSNGFFSRLLCIASLSLLYTSLLVPVEGSSCRSTQELSLMKVFPATCRFTPKAGPFFFLSFYFSFVSGSALGLTIRYVARTAAATVSTNRFSTQNNLILKQYGESATSNGSNFCRSGLEVACRQRVNLRRSCLPERMLWEIRLSSACGGFIGIIYRDIMQAGRVGATVRIRGKDAVLLKNRENRLNYKIGSGQGGERQELVLSWELRETCLSLQKKTAWHISPKHYQFLSSPCLSPVLPSPPHLLPAITATTRLPSYLPPYPKGSLPEWSK